MKIEAACVYTHTHTLYFHSSRHARGHTHTVHIHVETVLHDEIVDTHTHTQGTDVPKEEMKDKRGGA